MSFRWCQELCAFATSRGLHYPNGRSDLLDSTGYKLSDVQVAYGACLLLALCLGSPSNTSLDIKLCIEVATWRLLRLLPCLATSEVCNELRRVIGGVLSGRTSVGRQDRCLCGYPKGGSTVP